MIPEGLNISGALIALLMGVTLYIGGLHLWFWRGDRREETHGWVVAWCVTSLVFQGARLVQLSNLDPDVALLAGRIQVAAIMPLCVALAGFGTALRGHRWSARRRTTLLLSALALAALALTTPLLIVGPSDRMTDLFGRVYAGSPGTPALGGLLALLIGTGIHVLRQAQRAPLQPRERHVITASLVAYTACGLTSALTAMRVLPGPMLLEYAPVLLSVGLSYLLVNRHRRLTTELELLVGDRTSELRQSEVRYRRLVEEAPVAVIACNREGRVTAANPALLSLMGIASQEAALSTSVLTSPGFVEAGLSVAFESALRQGEAVHDDIAYATRWGRTASLRVHVVPLRNRLGSVQGAQAIIEDNSERAELEQSLRQSRKMQAVGQLAAGIAHEINNPMAYVRSNLRMLREELAAVESSLSKRAPSDDDASAERLAEGIELLDDALEGVERTVNLVREVKEFSHGSIGELQGIDVSQVLDDALRYATPERGESVRIVRSYGDVPQIDAAPDPLRQVFLNLIVNAFHAVGASGNVHLSIHGERGGVVVRVEDDGSGIEAGVRDRIFEPFFTTKGAGRGTGLGLYFSYEIVRMHGGELAVRSVPGEGTVFELWLPASAEPELLASAEE